MEKNYTYTKFDSKISNRLLIILIITIFITLSAFYPAAAQQKVKEIESYIEEIKDTEKANQLESLIYDVQPTVYINNGAFTPKGASPMSVANINAGDIGKLQESHASLNSVKLLLISFKDMQELQAFRLEPVNIGTMPNLAYVFLSFGFDVASAEIFPGIQGFDGSEIVFLYESARPF